MLSRIIKKNSKTHLKYLDKILIFIQKEPNYSAKIDKLNDEFALIGSKRFPFIFSEDDSLDIGETAKYKLKLIQALEYLQVEKLIFISDDFYTLTFRGHLKIAFGFEKEYLKKNYRYLLERWVMWLQTLFSLSAIIISLFVYFKNVPRNQINKTKFNSTHLKKVTEEKSFLIDAGEK